jgi:hypothetical protein
MGLAAVAAVEHELAAMRREGIEEVESIGGEFHVATLESPRGFYLGTASQPPEDA